MESKSDERIHYSTVIYNSRLIAFMNNSKNSLCVFTTIGREHQIEHDPKITNKQTNKNAEYKKLSFRKMKPFSYVWCWFIFSQLILSIDFVLHLTTSSLINSNHISHACGCRPICITIYFVDIIWKWVQFFICRTVE